MKIRLLSWFNNDKKHSRLFSMQPVSYTSTIDSAKKFQKKGDTLGDPYKTRENAKRAWPDEHTRNPDR